MSPYIHMDRENADGRGRHPFSAAARRGRWDVKGDNRERGSETVKKCLLALCLLLCLCGCGGEGEGDLLLGQAAGIAEESVLLTVDGREIPAWRYLYWLAFTCDQVQARYQEAGLTLDWGIPVTGGTMADYAKDQALADTALYATVETWAEEYGCTLTEEERGALEDIWREQSAAHGGESAYLAELAGLGLDRERAEELAEVGLLYAKLCRLYDEENSPLTGTPDDEENGNIRVDRILVSAGEDREAARQQAETLFARLNVAEDQAAEFSALAAAGDDPAGPRTFRPGDGTLDPALEEAAAALEEGMCSGILESGEGFSILRRLPPETPEAEQAAETAGEDEGFDRLLQDAAEKALVQTAAEYGRLDAAAFYQAVKDLRAAEE